MLWLLFVVIWRQIHSIQVPEIAVIFNETILVARQFTQCCNQSTCGDESNTIPIRSTSTPIVLKFNRSLDDFTKSISNFRSVPTSQQCKINCYSMKLELHMNDCTDFNKLYMVMYKIVETIMRYEMRPKNHSDSEWWNGNLCNSSYIKILVPFKSLCISGVYQIILIGYDESAKIVIITEIEIVDSISLQFPQNSIFPQCKDEFRVDFINRQSIPSGMDLRLRVFTRTTSMFSRTYYYVEEIVIGWNESALALHCSMFDIFYVEYCFQIVSIELQTSTLYEWSHQCIQTEKLSAVATRYDQWSKWTPCSKSCGTGSRRRLRIYTQLDVKMDNSYCKRNFVEVSTCNAGKCSESKSVTFLEGHCTCGCRINERVGSFLARNCYNETKWVLDPKESNLILIFVSLMHSSMNKIRIFNGESEQILVFKLTAYRNPRKVMITSDMSVTILLESFKNEERLEVEIFYEWINGSDVNTIINTYALSQQYELLKLNGPIAAVLISICILTAIIPPFFGAIVVFKMQKGRVWRQQRFPNSSGHNRPNSHAPCLPERSSTSIQFQDMKHLNLSAADLIQSFTTTVGEISQTHVQFQSSNTINGESSSPSFIMDHELEYDYYEPAIEGSYLAQPSIHSIINLNLELSNESNQPNVTNDN